MHRNRLVWGGVLILLGGLLLADEMGVRLPNGISPMDLFWPTLLLLAGVSILLGVFLRGNVESETASIDLQGARDASIRISHGAGEMKIHGGAGSAELLRGTFAGGLDHKATRNGDRLEVRMRPATDAFAFPFFGPTAQLDWDVALNADIPVALTFNTGANKSMIDLRDLRVTDLKLETGASDTRLTLPSRGRFRADLDLGAASLEVVMPQGISARIRASVAAGDINVDNGRFPYNGKYYQSPDYETAPNAVDMTIDAGAASVKIR